MCVFPHSWSRIEAKIKPLSEIALVWDIPISLDVGKISETYTGCILILRSHMAFSNQS